MKNADPKVDSRNDVHKGPSVENIAKIEDSSLDWESLAKRKDTDGYGPQLYVLGGCG